MVQAACVHGMPHVEEGAGNTLTDKAGRIKSNKPGKEGAESRAPDHRWEGDWSHAQGGCSMGTKKKGWLPLL